MNENARFDQLIAQGLEASRNDQTDVALDLFTQASALAPGSGIPHFLIGSEHAGAGNVEAAEPAFANAVLLAPEFHLARYQLGLLQYSSGRAAVALLTWQPLLLLPPADPLPHFVRGFTALALDQFQEALQHCHAGLGCREINPALAADIRTVVEAVEGLLQEGLPEPEAPATAGHVLLAGYMKGLH
jgi:Flp pilus assembly protein TadD